MSSDYESLVRRGYESWNAGDRNWVLEHMTPDVEWVPPPDDPDRSTYVGFEGVQRFWDEWRAAVGQLVFEPLEITRHGNDVIVVARRRGKGAHSGLEVSDEVIQVFSFGADDKCFRVREFYDRAEAMATVITAERQQGGGDGADS